MPLFGVRGAHAPAFKLSLVIRGLGATVVDEDKSDASRALVEYVAASPSPKIVDRSGTLSTAVQDIRSGKAISAIHIPPDFERDLKAQRRPQVVDRYKNQQFLTPAGIASSGLNDALSAAAAVAAPAKRAAAPASLGTLTGETITLVNPQKNYAQFLLRALLPTIIHVVAADVTHPFVQIDRKRVAAANRTLTSELVLCWAWRS